MWLREQVKEIDIRYNATKDNMCKTFKSSYALYDYLKEATRTLMST